MKKLMLAILFTITSRPILAMENRLIYDPQGHVIFQVRFFDQSDDPFIASGPFRKRSTWNMNVQQKEHIFAALNRWAEIIQPQPRQFPAIINVGTVNPEVAGASSDFVLSDSSTLLTQVQAVLFNKDPGELKLGSHGQFVIGRFDFDTLPYVPSQLSGDKENLATIAFHELAHTLGIGHRISYRDNNPYKPYYKSTLSRWTTHLRDDKGNPARPNQMILCKLCANIPLDDQDSFDVRQDKGYFTGPHVDEVLAGALPGIPVKMLDENGWLDSNYMSHPELKNSMMSHQNYRNHTNFMEAELALLQDLGYSIDRRNFYGHSLYGNGQTWVNRHGFFLRNPQGTDYITGQYNTATLGVGLHLYGSDNQVSQQADLLTSGVGGTGIRVDGTGNRLSIEPDTRIYADGLNGRGVMFTWGKGHHFIQRGDIQALGENGIATSFDFGNNAYGNDYRYRGSWIDKTRKHTIWSFLAQFNVDNELNGAMVETFDISGRLAGKTAAIFISSNALVSNINIMRGARLEGDIQSFYDQQDTLGQQRLTQLIFGQLADSRGIATEQADEQFILHHKGNIQGINSLALTAKGGYSALNGTHQVYNVTVAPGATLAGNSHWTLNSSGTFVNNGTLAPGNSLGRIEITGNWQQGENGRLLLDVDGKGQHDVLSVSGMAKLDGQLTLALEQDWYGSDWYIDLDNLLQAGSTSGTFKTLHSQPDSPSLMLQSMALDDNHHRLILRRKTNAYSQYGQNENTRGVGKALEKMALSARQDIQPLYRTLDFSAPDGSHITDMLGQLSPANYSVIFSSSLNREQQISGMINARRLVSVPSGLTENEWFSFALPFRSGFWQNRQALALGYDASSYGLLAGAEKKNERWPDWIMGLHGVISEQSVRVKSPENGMGKTTAFGLGLHWHHAIDPMAGSWMSGHGRVGMEYSSMERIIFMQDYHARHHADWTGLNTVLMTSGGWRQALNDKLSTGPFWALNYSRLWRPEITESGSDGSRLQLKPAHFNALHSSLGIQGNLNIPLEYAAGSTLQADVQLSWEHELLKDILRQNARFADYPDTDFSSKNQVTGRNGMNVQVGLTHELNRRVELGVRVSSMLLCPGYESLVGQFSATWHF